MEFLNTVLLTLVDRLIKVATGFYKFIYTYVLEAVFKSNTVKRERVVLIEDRLVPPAIFSGVERGTSWRKIIFIFL